MPRKKTWPGRIYLGRDENGQQKFWWCGRYPTKRERDDAVARARTERPWDRNAVVAAMTCDQWVDRYLARYERMVDQGERKASSLDTVEQSLKAFRREFGSRSLRSIQPVEAEDWSRTVPPSAVPQVVALFGYAVRMRVLTYNPFAGLGVSHGRGRAGQAPPTLGELDRLRAACDVLGEYGPRMRDLIDFAALTLMRPGELYELRYPDIDLRSNRIHVSRRVWRGTIDVPKNGRPKTIALVPPARAILLRQPTRTRPDGLVFTSKRGGRLSTTVMHGYWMDVRTSAALDREMPFYLATKHLGVSRLYQLGLSARAIAAQAGWSERSVDEMLRVYGHADVLGLAEVDALYARDADVTQDVPDAP